LPWLTFDELDDRADELDAWVARTPDIDTFCSSSAWILPAQAAFAPRAAPLVWSGAAGMVALMILELEGGVRAAVPLEASWGLASAILGPEASPVLGELFPALRARPAAERPRLLVFSGVAPDGDCARSLAAQGARPAGPVTDRIIASLEGGVDGFMRRRSAKFRASVQRARRHAANLGARYERHAVFDEDGLERLAARIFAVEVRSWKAAEGSGIDAGPMHDFYRRMLPRLARQGALRLVFVRLGDEDVAFCFGGLAGGLYRGLQVSFDDAHARMSPGVLAHLEMIELLAAEGVGGYDLGTDMDYKRRWGEPGLRTGAFVIVP
jgi:CelD/BcsL family acetyltransferase involved in cellulose biosynthesis